jgi:hypothetical protein
VVVRERGWRSERACEMRRACEMAWESAWEVRKRESAWVRERQRESAWVRER